MSQEQQQPENNPSEKALQWLTSRQEQPPTDPHEAIALLLHALLLQHGFRAAEPQGELATPSSWTLSALGGVYLHSRSSMRFHIRLTPVARHLVINAAADLPDATVHTLQLDTYEHTTPAPIWRERIARPSNIALLLAVQIAHRLVPDATKPGYEHAARATASTSTGDSSAASNRPASSPIYVPVPVPVPAVDNPLRVPPRFGRDDPLRVPSPFGPHNPLHVTPPFGRDDILPAGLRDPLRDPMRAGGAGGNLMGPAAFQRMGGARRPPGVPPGARFDPFGPPMPDIDVERVPPFDDEHGLRMPRPGAYPPGAGPPPDMYF